MRTIPIGGMAEIRHRRQLAAFLRRLAGLIESDMLVHRPTGLAIVLTSPDHFEVLYRGIRQRTHLSRAGSSIQRLIDCGFKQTIFAPDEHGYLVPVERQTVR